MDVCTVPSLGEIYSLGTTDPDQIGLIDSLTGFIESIDQDLAIPDQLSTQASRWTETVERLTRLTPLPAAPPVMTTLIVEDLALVMTALDCALTFAVNAEALPPRLARTALRDLHTTLDQLAAAIDPAAGDDCPDEFPVTMPPAATAPPAPGG